jgi:hypothetical protein
MPRRAYPRIVGSDADSRTPAVISDYNARYGEMDAALWCLSLRCRAPLVKQCKDRVIEVLISTIEKWRHVRGVPGGTAAVMAQKLANIGFSRETFEQGPLAADAEEYAVTLVRKLVYDTREEAPATRDGKRRREFSLAAKTLHWLLPWRVPAYDSYVRARLGTARSFPGQHRRSTHPACRDRSSR